MEAWTASVNALSKKGFCEKVEKFDPSRITSNQLKSLMTILQNQDIKEQRLAVESPLAADLCRWVKAAASFAK